MVKRTPMVLSAFTGAGGLDLGLEAAGFRTIACLEIDPAARQTLVTNRPDWHLLPEPDIIAAAKRLCPQDLGLKRRELDVLAGGPPCQPFSKAAQWAPRGRAGLRDPRARTLTAFTRLVDTFLPKAILIENVPGFVLGRTSAAEELGVELRRINQRHGTHYEFDVRILNAEEYGAPQMRRRAILIATRDGGAIKWPCPQQTLPPRSFDALAHIRPRQVPEASGKWAWLLPTIPPGQNYLFHTPSGAGEPFFGERRRFWSFLLKLDPARPAWTLPAKPGPSTGPFHWSNRPLAIEEMLALQTFPADWSLSGGRGAQIRQVGNATPPLLAEQVGRSLGIAIFGLSYEGLPRLRVQRSEAPPPRVPVTPVPPNRRPKGRKPTPHPGEGRGPRPAKRVV